MINPKTSEKPFYKSKKFWYAVVIAVAGIAREAGLNIPMEAIYAGLALILGQGLADLGKNKVEKNASPAPASAEASLSPPPSPEDIPQPETTPEIKPEAQILEETKKPKAYEEMTPWEVEQAHLAYFEERLRKAREYLRFVQDLYKDIPQGREEIELAQTMVKDAEHSLEVEKTLIEAVKTGKALPVCEAHYYIIGSKPPWKQPKGKEIEYLDYYRKLGWKI